MQEKPTVLLCEFPNATFRLVISAGDPTSVDALTIERHSLDAAGGNRWTAIEFDDHRAVLAVAVHSLMYQDIRLGAENTIGRVRRDKDPKSPREFVFEAADGR